MCVLCPTSLCVGPVQGDDKNTPSSFSQKVSHKGLGHKMSTTMWCEMGVCFGFNFKIAMWLNGQFSQYCKKRNLIGAPRHGGKIPITRENQFFTGTGDHRIYIYHCQISTVNGRESSTSTSKSSMTSTATTLLASILLPLIAFSDAAVGSSLLFFLLLAFAQTSLHYFPNYFSFNCLFQFQAIAERRKSVSLTKVAKWRWTRWRLIWSSRPCATSIHSSQQTSMKWIRGWVFLFMFHCGINSCVIISQVLENWQTIADVLRREKDVLRYQKHHWAWAYNPRDFCGISSGKRFVIHITNM